MNLPVTRYGVGVGASLLLFWLASWLWLRGRKVSYAQFTCYAACTAVLGWLCARVMFVLCTIPTYIMSYDGYFAPALFFWDGGYAMTGLLLGLAAGAALAAKLTGTRKGVMMNAAGFALPLGVAALRLTEHLTETAESGDIGEGYFIEEGWLTDLLSRLGLLMEADGDYCYPISLLAFAAALIVFLVLTVWLCTRRWEAIPGDVMMVALLLICCAQVIIEPLRNDGHLHFHLVQLQQIVALLILCAVIHVWIMRHRRVSRDKRKSLVIWGIMAVCIIVGIIAVFMIDRHDNKTLAWSLLIVPMIILGVTGLYARAAANYITGE